MTMACSLTLSAILSRLPQHVARAFAVGIAAGDKQEIGQPVDVLQHLGADALARLVLELGDQPLGSTKDFNGASASLSRSISLSSQSTCACVTVSRAPSGPLPLPGVHRSAPTSNRSFWMRDSAASSVTSPAVCNRAMPMAALASSSVP